MTCRHRATNEGRCPTWLDAQSPPGDHLDGLGHVRPGKDRPSCFLLRPRPTVPELAATKRRWCGPVASAGKSLDGVGSGTNPLHGGTLPMGCLSSAACLDERFGSANEFRTGIVEAASDRSAAEGCRAAPVYPFHDSMIARGISLGGSDMRFRHLLPQCSRRSCSPLRGSPPGGRWRTGSANHPACVLQPLPAASRRRHP